MRIDIRTDLQIDETELIIRCRHLTPEIDKLLSYVRIMQQQIIGSKGGESYVLDIVKILFAESVERQTFLYTIDGVYETNLKLYELEEQLSDMGFFRINKSSIVNLTHVKSLKADINRRIRVTLDNGEKLMVSRQYADTFKKRLGLK